VAIQGSSIGALATAFDIVLNHTPVENPTPNRPTLVSMAGVVHGATLHAGAASGSWVTLFGDALSGVTRTWAESDFSGNSLPQSIDGVSVRVNSQPASVYYVSPKQINILAPDVTVEGSAQVTVTNSSGTSDAVNVQIRQFMPGFFQFPSEHVSAVRADGTFVGPEDLMQGVTTAPARSGDTVLLFGTGFGPTNPVIPAGTVVTAPAPTANPVKIRIHNLDVPVAFAGLTGPGLYQFNITIPDLADGDYPVTAEVAGVRTAKFARIRIQRQASANAAEPSDAGPYLALLDRIRGVIPRLDA
jgi:uncharacterized protein (TIGR03437 family)